MKTLTFQIFAVLFFLGGLAIIFFVVPVAGPAIGIGIGGAFVFFGLVLDGIARLIRAIANLERPREK